MGRTPATLLAGAVAATPSQVGRQPRNTTSSTCSLVSPQARAQDLDHFQGDIGTAASTGMKLRRSITINSLSSIATASAVRSPPSTQGDLTENFVPRVVEVEHRVLACPDGTAKRTTARADRVEPRAGLSPLQQVCTGLGALGKPRMQQAALEYEGHGTAVAEEIQACRARWVGRGHGGWQAYGTRWWSPSRESCQGLNLPLQGAVGDLFDKFSAIAAKSIGLVYPCDASGPRLRLLDFRSRRVS